MSTPFRVRLASRSRRAAVLAARRAGRAAHVAPRAARSAALSTALVAALAACGRGPSVSYAGLDRPASWDAPPPVRVAVLVDATGPGSAAGVAFADALRARFAEPAPALPGRPQPPEVHVHVLDDRGREPGVRGAAARAELDPGAHVVISTPGLDRAARAAELAPHTVVVCAGCRADEVTREGAFALDAGGGDPAEDARAAADWIRAAMAGEAEWTSRRLAVRLRARRPERGAFQEGSAPSAVQYQFSEPPVGGARP
ncbi:MAG: hypothetical protein JNK02_05135 [Planctomycetes bacterium]|nr:hypothetical protein [Planctomycetota bacterium]